MKIRKCDICERNIKDHETYYRMKEHWWNGFQIHNSNNLDICQSCFKEITKICKKKKDISNEKLI